MSKMVSKYLLAMMTRKSGRREHGASEHNAKRSKHRRSHKGRSQSRERRVSPEPEKERVNEPQEEEFPENQNLEDYAAQPLEDEATLAVEEPLGDSAAAHSESGNARAEENGEEGFDIVDDIMVLNGDQEKNDFEKDL